MIPFLPNNNGYVSVHYFLIEHRLALRAEKAAMLRKVYTFTVVLSTIAGIAKFSLKIYLVFRLLGDCCKVPL